MPTLRVAIYGRVSSEEQIEGYSLDAQSRACREYAATHGWQVAGEYVDEGKSARVDDIAKRPSFRRLMQDATAHTFDLLIVHKIDRFSRNRRVAFDCFDRLAKAGIGFVSISENMDFSAPWGQFALTMLVGLAQLYSDNLSTETRKGKRERKAQGMYNGALPYGAAKGPDGVPIPHPEQHAHLCHMFTLASQGQSDAQIAVALNAKGVLTDGIKGKNPWRKDTVRRVLSNRFYLGELPLFETRTDHKKPVLIGWQQGKHAPLIDGALFDAAQAEREANRKNKRVGSTPHAKRTYILSGLLYCARCGAAMRIRGSSKDSVVRVGCYGRSQGLGCDAPHSVTSVYEDQIGQWVKGFKLPDDAIEIAMAEIAKETKMVDDSEGERRNVQARLSRIKEMYGWGHIERGEYLAEHDQLSARLRALAPPQEQRRDLDQMAALIRALPERWDELEDSEANKLLSRLVSRVTINEHRVVTVSPRPDALHLLPVWQGATCGSDGERRPTLPHLSKVACQWGYPSDLLKQIAKDAGSYTERAARYGVHTSTVQRACRLYG